MPVAATGSHPPFKNPPASANTDGGVNDESNAELWN